MGDLRVWLPRPTGLSTDEIQSPSTSSSLSNPCLSSISVDSWSIAEHTTCGIICRIQPTIVSEQRRREVVDYVQRLIKWNIGNEVFPFGSVPLKTYLPDGDIDLTAFGTQNVEEVANEVCFVLEMEEQNSNAEFEVKDVQYIHAEVKLVKCLVQNIVVDISFNQLGGLCTLCFLEQVDQLIGKDNLFKRSVILIKAWCYYESRILGAHHGLISTYALETLVLYTFNVFHTSLHGPVAVLYKFLDYYSKFDWDNYCVSLNGPVCVSSLPDTVVETPETDGCELLLTKEFLSQCIEKFSVSSKGYESNSRSFPRKHLNIFDPLKENNNLGRSVSKGNFYRIRSAFTYGARKLGRILLLPAERIPDELNKFFTNTLDRHGSGQRPDVQDIVSNCLDQNSLPFFNNGSGHAPPNVEFEKYEERTVSGASYVESSGSVCGPVDRDVLCNIRILELEKKHGMTMQSGRQTSGNELQRCTREDFSSTQSESNLSTEGVIISGNRLAGDANDLANETCKSLPPSSEPGNLSYVKPNHAPHLFFSRSFSETRENRKGDQDQSKPTSFSDPENVVPFRPQTFHSLQPNTNEINPASNSTFRSYSSHEGLAAASLTDCSVVSSSGKSLAKANSFNHFEASSRDISVFGSRDCDSVGTTGSSEASDGLSELSGDYDSHLKNMHYGQWCHEHFSNGPFFPAPPSPSQVRNKHSWDPLYRPLHMKRNLLPHMNANGVVAGPSFPPASAYYHAMNQPVVPGAFGGEEMPKPRGTGTYFPNTNHRQYRERISPGRGRTPVPVTQSQLPRPRGNGRAAATVPDTNFSEKGNQEMSQVHQHPVAMGNGRGKPGEFLQAGHPFARSFPYANGFMPPPSERIDFGSFGSLQVGAPSLESVRQPDSSSAPQMNPSMQRPGSRSNQERRYHLKDDADFPPLSV